MPMADEADSDFGRPTRTFIYGPDKTKKTWWALRAAEAGFNVILIDGDDGSSIKNQLPMEARKKILVIDAVNTTDRAVFARFVASFFREQKPFVWDEQAKTQLMGSTYKPDHSYVQIDTSKFTMNDVVILDSWTALAASLLIEWARENNIDLTAVDREGDQFSLMGYQSRFLDYVLTKIKTLPCHIIVIGHETVYEKFATNSAGKRIVTETHTQPFSSTGPHAKKIGSHFSNYLRFTRISDVAYRISTSGDKEVAGGSRQLAPKTYKWEDLTPNDIFKAVGSKPTSAPCLGAVYIPKGSAPQIATNSVETQQTNPAAEKTPAQPQVVQAGSLATRLALNRNKP